MLAGISAAGGVFHYVQSTLRRGLKHVLNLSVYKANAHVLIDTASSRNLDLVEHRAGRQHTLLGALDRTKTPMGARKLRHWILNPLRDADIIRSRHDLIESLILRIKERNFRGKKQDEAKASYCCRRTPEDGEINWSKNTREIFNLYRAVSPPAPGCFTFFNGKKIYILDCEIIDDRSSYVGSVSGRIVHSSKSEGYVDVLTGDGILRLNLVKVGNEIFPPSKIIKSISSTLGN